MRFKNSIFLFIAIQFLIVMGILLGLEIFAQNQLKKSNQQKDFFYNKSQFERKKIQDLKAHGFYLLDPLLGWGSTEDKKKEKGFLSKNNCVLLQSKAECEYPLRLFISGGSTADVVLHLKNWPFDLTNLMNAQGLCFEIYVAATGGYSSGQELLKFIRDGSAIRPDIVISYSGANENLSPKYVSRHEQNFFVQSFTGKLPSVIFPNLYLWVRHFLIQNQNEEMELYFEDRKSPVAFWLNNMSYYNALSNSTGAKFIGILQPVFGFAGQKNQILEGKNERFVEGYKTYYPQLKDSILKSDFLYDATEWFAMESENVFVDDCHLKDKFQSKVAERILERINLMQIKK